MSLAAGLLNSAASSTILLAAFTPQIYLASSASATMLNRSADALFAVASGFGPAFDLRQRGLARISYTCVWLERANADAGMRGGWGESPNP